MKYPLLGCMLMLSVAFCLWSARSVWATAAETQFAREELEDCLKIASDIDALDLKPQRVSRSADLGDAVYAALELAKLQDSRRSVQPVTASKFGTSGYTQEQAVIIADGWTMPQTTHFLQVIEQEYPSIRVTNLSLTAQRTKVASAKETWGCRITLTQFVASQITLNSP
jgi:hypothetical protein